jgi:hypothetical protein
MFAGISKGWVAFSYGVRFLARCLAALRVEKSHGFSVLRAFASAGRAHFARNRRQIRPKIVRFIDAATVALLPLDRFRSW